MVSKMEKIETHFIDDGPYCRLKVDVKTIRKNIVGIRILSYNRKMEFETTIKTQLIWAPKIIDFHSGVLVVTSGVLVVILGYW